MTLLNHIRWQARLEGVVFSGLVTGGAIFAYIAWLM